MFEALLLQQWYVLSDPGLEEALLDRLSFRRFRGLGNTDKTPDETTFVRFRGALTAAGVSAALFEELNRQFAGRGLLVKAGTLIDASLVRAAARGRRVAGGAMESADPETAFTQVNGRAFFGTKMHIVVDRDSGAQRKALADAGIEDAIMWAHRPGRGRKDRKQPG